MTYGKMIKLPAINTEGLVQQTWTEDYILFCSRCDENRVCYPVIWICPDGEENHEEELKKDDSHSDDEYTFDEKNMVHMIIGDSALRCGTCDVLDGELSSFNHAASLQPYFSFNEVY